MRHQVEPTHNLRAADIGDSNTADEMRSIEAARGLPKPVTRVRIPAAAPFRSIDSGLGRLMLPQFSYMPAYRSDL